MTSWVDLQNRTSFALLLGLLILGQTLILFVNSEYILTEAIYRESLAHRLSDQRMVDVLENQRAMGWMNYLYAPLYYPLKIFTLFAILFTGLFLFDVKVNSLTMLKVIAFSELILLMGGALKSLIFFMKTGFTLDEFWRYKSLSILEMINNAELPNWALFPLGMLNAFHLTSVLVLTYGIKVCAARTYTNVGRSVFLSYSSGLMLLVVISIYISIVNE